MKLMVLLSRVPYPLDKGDKLRAFHQIKYLSKHYDIVLCCLNDRRLHPDAIENLSPYCKDIKVINLSKIGIAFNLLQSLFSGKPFQVHYFYHRSAQKQVDRFIEKHMPKHIYCQLIRVAEYVKKYTIIPKTLDYQDTFSKGAERRMSGASLFLKPILSREAKRLEKYEHDIFSMFDNKIIISKQDQQLIPHPNKNDIVVVPNGVDTSFFHPMETKKDYDIVFTGNMNYPPNIESACYIAKVILPAVLKTKPNTKLLISGSTPSAKVTALQGAHVEVTGWIDDIRTSYARAKVFIAPMQTGTGLQNKLLEAMAMQLPCITSPLANNALGAMPNQHILIGNSPDEYAQHICSLLDNPNLSKSIAESGYLFVQHNFNWESTCNKLQALISN
jgi:sugar transferase (PEP-CTERM/EpsH1 system associated)